MDLSVLKIICLMSKIYTGFVYHVSIAGSDYVIKHGHLDEFVALMHNQGAIVVNDFVKTKVCFAHVSMWYYKV
jgi:type IV secretory pathway TrbF-like protein